MNETKKFIDSLFEGYEQTTALLDFKEELLGNLNAKIESLVKKGMDEKTAFAKASTELEDISALADELSLKKRKEVFEEVYMDIRNFISVKRAAAYVLFGITALFGIVTALIVLFTPQSSNLSGVFGSMFPFLTAAAIGFTWLGVTQETASTYPSSKKRAAWYAAGAGLIAFGLLTMPIVFFESTDTAGAIAVLIPFVLPGAGLLLFLILTEKNRLKPWAKDFHDKAYLKKIN